MSNGNDLEKVSEAAVPIVKEAVKVGGIPAAAGLTGLTIGAFVFGPIGAGVGAIVGGAIGLGIYCFGKKSKG